MEKITDDVRTKQLIQDVGKQFWKEADTRCARLFVDELIADLKIKLGDEKFAYYMRPRKHARQESAEFLTAIYSCIRKSSKPAITPNVIGDGIAWRLRKYFNSNLDREFVVDIIFKSAQNIMPEKTLAKFRSLRIRINNSLKTLYCKSVKDNLTLQKKESDEARRARRVSRRAAKTGTKTGPARTQTQTTKRLKYSDRKGKLIRNFIYKELVLPKIPAEGKTRQWAQGVLSVTEHPGGIYLRDLLKIIPEEYAKENLIYFTEYLNILAVEGPSYRDDKISESLGNLKTAAEIYLAKISPAKTRKRAPRAARPEKASAPRASGSERTGEIDAARGKLDEGRYRMEVEAKSPRRGRIPEVPKWPKI